jgi:hypothetical protein
MTERSFNPKMPEAREPKEATSIPQAGKDELLWHPNLLRHLKYWFQSGEAAADEHELSLSSFTGIPDKTTFHEAFSASRCVLE